MHLLFGKIAQHWLQFFIVKFELKDVKQARKLQKTGKRILLVLLLWIVVLGVTPVKAQERPFRKKISSTLEVFEVITAITELRSRPNDLNQGIPNEYLFSQKEYSIITHTLYLQEAGRQREILWEYQVEFPKPDPTLSTPDISISDVILQNKRASVIFKSSSLVNAASIRKTPGATREWLTLSEDVIKPQSGIEPITDIRFQVTERKPTIQLKIFKQREKKIHYLVEVYELQENNRCQRWKKIRTFKESFPEDL